MYATSKTATIFPLTATRPVGFVGRSHASENKELVRKAALPVVSAPIYETEMDVTRAIADGSFKGFASEAYALAKRYQAYLKTLKPHFFRKASASTVVGLNFRPGYSF
jgi:hypothetical protein